MSRGYFLLRQEGLTEADLVKFLALQYGGQDLNVWIDGHHGFYLWDEEHGTHVLRDVDYIADELGSGRAAYEYTCLLTQVTIDPFEVKETLEAAGAMV